MAAPFRFQKHSHSGHLADHIHFGVFEQGRRFLRGWMGFEQQASRDKTAPTDAISAAMFQEIDGPVEFRGPSIGCYFSVILID